MFSFFFSLSHFSHSFVNIFISFRILCARFHAFLFLVSRVILKIFSVSSTISRRSPLPDDPFPRGVDQIICFFTLFLCLYIFFALDLFAFRRYFPVPFLLSFVSLFYFSFSLSFAWVLDFLFSPFTLALVFLFILFRSRFEPRNGSTVRSVFPRSTRVSKNHSRDT